MEYLQNKKFGDLLTEFVLNKLTGQHEDFKRKEYPSLPSNEITIGVLFGEKIDDEDELEKIKDNLTFRSKTNSIKFLLNDLNNPPKIETKLSIFYRIIPSYEEEKKYIETKNFFNEKEYPIARIWKRYDITFDQITFNSFDETISLNFKNALDDIRNSEKLVKTNFRIKKESMESEEKYNEFINNKINENSYLRASDDLKWNCELSITNEPFIQKNKEVNLVEITLINNTDDKTEQHSKSTILHEPSIFNPILNITLDDEIIPFYYTYEFEGKEKSYESYFRCNNCQATLNEPIKTITTKAYGEFNENKILPKSNIPNIDISFEKMASDENIGELNVIYHEITEYYNRCSENNTDTLENLTNFLNMRNKFSKGIKLLKENDIVNNAFKLMNKTFDEKSKNSDYHSWRLFQLVFIVSEIPDIVLEENRDICDLLHVQTGGGKSEAYFGIVIFTAFYDRLRGKSFGVSAITKFPLRMLSVQQLQRIAELFIFAEKIRTEENIAGEEFSIAYYVGSQEDEFPRHNRPIRRDIAEAKKEDGEIPGKIIDTCPICGGNVILDIDSKEVIIHKCKSCKRIFRLYYSDDEVYRMLPTFIVATVDKFAGISMNRRVKNIFGGRIDKGACGHGYIPHNDSCEFEEGRRNHCKESGKEVKINFNTGPTLIIQDEMHLIREGFGTIDSHFETLTETLQEKMGGQKFKNIVMTATVSGAENQIRNLYNKQLNVFPPSLKDSEDNDFFFEKLTDENDEPVIQRKIIGLKPNSMNTRIMLHTIRYIAEFIINVENNLETVSKDCKIPSNELVNIISYYKTMLTYHNKKENVHSTNFHIEDYVNKPITYTVESRPLTGDNDLNYIKETISLVNGFNKEKSLHAVHATNIVSHGVDIDRWNVMIFEGMPRSTAEYIQSLSRVGRKYYGIVFLTFDAKRTRDLSFFKHFTEYHDIIDYKVEPVPLARWAKLGIKQTITSVFCASILNYLSNELKTPIYNTEQLREVLTDEKNVKLLLDFIDDAYVTFVGECDENMENNINEDVKERIDYLMNYAGTEQNFFPNALKDCDDKYYRTQFGMRGIQDELQLTPYNSDLNFRKTLKE